MADNNVAEIVEPELDAAAWAFRLVISSSGLTIVAAADLDAPSLKVLFPGNDWTDPRKAMLVVNEGTEGALHGHQVVNLPNMRVPVRILDVLLGASKQVFVPCATVALMSVATEYVNRWFPAVRVLGLHKGSLTDLKRPLAGNDPTGWLRMETIDVLAVTPVMSTGFSIDGGWFDSIVAFFTALPAMPETKIQSAGIRPR